MNGQGIHLVPLFFRLRIKAKVIMAAGTMNKPKIAENIFTSLRWHKIAQAEILCNDGCWICSE